MATPEEDYALSTEERLAERSKALDKYTSITPAQQKVDDQETGKAFSNVRGIASQAAEAGTPKARMGFSSGLGKAANDLATLDVKQASEKDATDITGAKMQQDTIFSRKMENIQAFQRKADQAAFTQGELVASKAFSMGMDAKELILHKNAIVADAALAQQAKEYSRGRLTAFDVKKITNDLRLQAQEIMNQIDAQMAQLDGELKYAISTKDLSRLKIRIDKIHELQLAAAKSIAAGSSYATLLAGGMQIAGGAISKYKSRQGEK